MSEEKRINKPALPTYLEHWNSSLKVPELHSHPGISIREYAAIHLRIPDSGNAELDAMIQKSRRQDILISVINGGISTARGPIVGHAVVLTDEIIEELQEENS